MNTVTTIITNGAVTGAIYGLVSVGLTLVYKKSGVLNFANAEIGMLAAFLFYALFVEQGVPYLVAAGVGVVMAALLGAVTYLVLAPRRDDPLMMLIGTLGAGGVILWVAIDVWGTNPYFVPPPLGGLEVNFLGFQLAGPRLLALVVAAGLGLGSLAVFRYSSVGLIFRASAADPYAAELMGIDVRRMDVATWAVAGGLAGLAGILIAPLVGFHVFFMSLLAARGFAAALLTGMTSIAGALVASFGLGLAEAGLTRATPEPGLSDAVLVFVIVAILVFRPTHVGRRTA